MAPPQIDLKVLDDNARWADDTECIDLLIAGIWFLHDTLKSRYPKCDLLQRITQFGDRFERMRSASGGDATNVSGSEAASFFAEMNTLLERSGTLSGN